MQIHNYKKILADMSAVHATDFWREYITRIIEYRKTASRQCEIKEDVKEFQGEVKAYDMILALPQKIEKDLEEKIAITSGVTEAA